MIRSLHRCSHDDILTEIQVPAHTPGSGGAYLKLEKRVGDFAIVGVGVQISLDSRGTCLKAGIGLTAVGPTAIKATNSEEYLVGKNLADVSVLSRAGVLASEQSSPTTDLRGPLEYKKEMVKIFVIRSLKVAHKRTVGGGM